MPKTTPFHTRLAPANKPAVWEHWAGYLSAPRYQYSVISEYYAVRNAAALFDTSPLFKYRFSGPGAESFLSTVLVRDVRRCAVRKAQYTAWCNPAGFVIEDGVIMRIAPDSYLLTAARPNLRYFSNLPGAGAVHIEDVSAAYGVLALQGPHCRNILHRLTHTVDELRYFCVANTTIAGCAVTLSRTGYTGDLGYEIWVSVDDALTVYDALAAAGADYNMTLMGSTALMMARIEAGLLLIDVDFTPARYSWVDAQRETPLELGWAWMLRGLNKDDRAFIGREAIEKAVAGQTSRWQTVGLVIDWRAYERVHRDAGIMPPKANVLVQETLSIYRLSGEYAGYATSFVYSSLLKQHIAIAKVPLDMASPGSELALEIMVIRRPERVLARVTSLPFYNPARKTARPQA